MPSRLYQHAIIIPGKKKKDGTRAAPIIIAEKTGYLNLTVNGKHYYKYNASMINQSMNQKNIAQQFINQNTPNKKKTITISRRM